jgi:hypothetical protein
VFNGTRHSDTGNYTCRAYNGIGTSVVSSSYLEIYCKYTLKQIFN